MCVKLTNKNRFSCLFPDVAEEWDYKSNSPLTPDEFSYGSHKIVVWCCKTCGEKWKTSINKRCIEKTGCPFCSGRKVCQKSSLFVKFPEISCEWDCNRNRVGPEKSSCFSNKAVWWKCRFGHGWKANVYNRTVRGDGCPYCSGRKASRETSFASIEREIMKDWDFSKNTVDPYGIRPRASVYVWWKCHVCLYEWCCTADNRTAGHKCPSCTGNVVSDINRLSILRPELSLEWDYDRNSPVTPEDVSYGSNKAAWWLCKVCNNSWEATINSRSSGRGCIVCSKGGVSKASQVWLDSFGVPKKNREVWLPELGIRVDGLDPETNTAYEFLGDYWHGNPIVYYAEEVNPHNGKTFGLLFDETLERLFLLRRRGYSLNVIWEGDC